MCRASRRGFSVPPAWPGALVQQLSVSEARSSLNDPQVYSSDTTPRESKSAIAANSCPARFSGRPGVKGALKGLRVPSLVTYVTNGERWRNRFAGDRHEDRTWSARAPERIATGARRRLVGADECREQLPGPGRAQSRSE